IPNVRVCAFAAFYNCSLTVAPRGCARFKGRVERPFRFVEENLLNGRKFTSLEDFKEVLAWWTDARAMRQPHPDTRRPIADMFEAERPHLQPLPARPYDTREVVVRLVDGYGYVQHQTNFYRVPAKHIGALVYLCVDIEPIEGVDHGIHRPPQHQRRPAGRGL